MGASTSAMGSLADDTRWMDATEQAELVAKGEFTPVELLDAAVERIERDDTAINAVVLRWFDRAREAAASAELPDGPFRGVPFLLKDLFASMAGMPLTNGNKALAAAPPVSAIDTTLVSRHRAAGFVIAGRTNSPELGSLPVTEPEAYGADPQPVEPRPHAGRVERRIGRRRRRRHGADRPRLRRRRIDPHSRLVLRVGRAQGQPGKDHARPPALRVGSRRRALREPHGPRHRSPARRHTRSRCRRHRVGAASGPAVRRRGRRRSRGRCGSVFSTTIPATSGSTTTASTPSAPPRRCSRDSAIASNRGHPPCSPMRRSPRGSWRCGRRAWRSASRRSAPSSAAR